jgi:CRP/FNR family cyclic AMP-dependent transcriptional regulator
LIDKGDFIYQPNEGVPSVYLIEQGLVKTGCFSPEGERIVNDVLRAGDTCGNLQYLTGELKEGHTFAQAATSAIVYPVRLPLFQQVLEQESALAHWFNNSLIRRWSRAESRLIQRACNSIESRIDQLRQDFDTPILDAHNRTHHLFNILTHQEIGDIIGSTRQTVSKKLKSLTYLLVPFITELL